jgi:hypothetical protein
MLSSGICIEKRGQPIGLLTAWPPGASKRPLKPDFTARRWATWGNRVFSEADVTVRNKAFRKSGISNQHASIN